ncbi:putative serine/threonine-protein kinase PBL2 [Bidens hawaiensis]|uniref:putative serine/threonine-protein kinase PBL2 n=1 Tax=Bidens hawaiensis TaxID=980011 RepID=UPI004049B50E
MAIAAKALNPTYFQGHKDWLSEVICLGQIDHPNLLNLIGLYSEGENRFMVYELMPLGSEEPLSWKQTINVAVEVAQGHSYLHASESKDYNVKLSDFVFAKPSPMDDMSHVDLQQKMTYITLG